VVRYSYLGEFELLVMLATLHAGDEAYGVTIREAIEARTGRPVSRGSLYLTLERLVDKGFLRARMADATRVRGHRPRKYYRVRKAGLVAIRESRASVTVMWRGLESVLGKA
jgi:PadR family transcriptional regulator, regulatory protein PadR